MSVSNIYRGIRGNEFRKLITSILKRGNIKPKYINQLTDDDGMRLYDQAFTASSANLRDNYEFFEQLGDVTAGKFIVWYAYRRFPQLKCPEGVKVVARLKINYGARATFADLGEKLGFWNFISAAETQPEEGPEKGKKYRSNHKKDLLEDCVESFCGVTEYILDERYRPGVGNAIVYDILRSIFDEITISLKYRDLYDAKTRMKEIFDAHKDMGTWKYQDTRDEETRMCTSKVYLIPTGRGHRPELIGTGVAARKGDAQQKAADEAIVILNKADYKKDIPPEYAKFDSL